MNIFKDLARVIKPHHILVLFGLVILGIALMQYSNKKGMLLDPMTTMMNPSPYSDSATTNQTSNPVVGLAASLPDNAAPVSNMSGPSLMQAPSCNQAPTLSPADLLPRDNNSDWSNMNPPTAGMSMPFLTASQLTGIDTVGSSMRNANLQVRSEPPNPQIKVSPWLNSTIEPDLMRQPLEIGLCPGR